MLWYIFIPEGFVWYGKRSVGWCSFKCHWFCFVVSNVFRKLVVRLWLIGTIHHWLTDGFEVEPEVQVVSGCKMSIETTVRNLRFRSDVDVVWSLLGMALCCVSDSHVSKAREGIEVAASPTVDIGLNRLLWHSRIKHSVSRCVSLTTMKTDRLTDWLTPYKISTWEGLQTSASEEFPTFFVTLRLHVSYPCPEPDQSRPRSFILLL